MALYELESALNAAVATARSAALASSIGAPRLLAYLSEAQKIVACGSILKDGRIDSISGTTAPPGLVSSSPLLVSLQSTVLSIFLQAVSLMQAAIRQLAAAASEGLAYAHDLGLRGRRGPSSRSSAGSLSGSPFVVQRRDANRHSPPPTSGQRSGFSNADSVVSSSIASPETASVNRRLGSASGTAVGRADHRNPQSQSSAFVHSQSLLGGLPAHALLDLVGSAVQLMDRVANASSKILADRTLKLRQSSNCSTLAAASIMDPNLELLRELFCNEDNARLWARHFGLHTFTASTIDVSSKIILETNHISEAGGARGKAISDLVLNVLDLNGDGTIDIVEFALALPAKSIISAVEQRVQHLVTSHKHDTSVGDAPGSDAAENCERCRMLEAELALAGREVARLQTKIRDVNALLKASGAAVAMQQLQTEIDFLRGENDELRRAVASSHAERKANRQFGHREALLPSSANYASVLSERSQDAVARSKALLESDRLRRAVLERQEEIQEDCSPQFWGLHKGCYSSSIAGPSTALGTGPQQQAARVNAAPRSVLQILEAGVHSANYEAPKVQSFHVLHEDNFPEGLCAGNVEFWSASASGPTAQVTRHEREVSMSLDRMLESGIEESSRHDPHILSSEGNEKKRIEEDDAATAAFSQHRHHHRHHHNHPSPAGGKKNESHGASKTRTEPHGDVDQAALPSPSAVDISSLISESTRHSTPPPGPRVRRVENFL
jgi:hypothetical protein